MPSSRGSGTPDRPTRVTCSAHSNAMRSGSEYREDARHARNSFRVLTLGALVTALRSTMTTTAMILLVIVGSTGFSQLLAATGSTSALVALVTELEFSALTMVLVMQGIVLVLGCFIDTISIMLVAIPVFMPIVNTLGIDPIRFAILILVQLELAGITPPFGVLLFVMKGVQQHLRISQIYRAALPIVLIQFALIALLMLFPDLTTTLPDMALD